MAHTNLLHLSATFELLRHSAAAAGKVFYLDGGLCVGPMGQTRLGQTGSRLERSRKGRGVTDGLRLPASPAYLRRGEARDTHRLKGRGADEQVGAADR